jgi:plastocyanin
MRRLVVLGALLGTAAALVGLPGTALAGGGCHAGMTEADATGEEGPTIRMVDQCFTANVLRVDPGTSVTFKHQDVGITHNVTGAGWGFYGDMHEGDIFTATFDDPGVYPFACSYHPGMTGAIVVGDGYGAGVGWSVLNSGPTSGTQGQAAAAPRAAGDDAPPIALLGVGALGLALGVGVVGLLRRRARPSGG